MAKSPGDQPIVSTQHWFLDREDNGTTVTYFLNLSVSDYGTYKIKIAASHYAELAKLVAKAVK